MNFETKGFERVEAAALTAHGTAPIPARPYYDPAYFELEREAVFRRNWLIIGHACEVSQRGSFFTRRIEVANVSVLVVHGKDGAIRAFHNVCPHRDTELVAADTGEAMRFTCRYHSWTFGTDGGLIAAPEIDSFFVDKKDCGLKPIALEICAGLLFINLDRASAIGLRESLGPYAEALEALPIAKAVAFAEYDYEIAANWKLTFDNFQENYHIRYIHPRTIVGMAAAEENPFGYPTGYDFHGPHRAQSLWTNIAFQPQPVQAKALAALGADAMQLGSYENLIAPRYYALFPNFFLSGSTSMHFSHSVWPISADRSRGTVRFYWTSADESATQRFAREYAMASALDIHAEDFEIIEAGQRGLSTGALEHIHFQTQEVLCRHLFNTVDAMVAAYRRERDAG